MPLDEEIPKVQLSRLKTETAHPDTENLDTMSVLQALTTINNEDRGVPEAVRTALPQIATAVTLISDALAGGGRLIYLGAGTSGRLGWLDAVECPPTFGTAPAQVTALLAGGPDAFTSAVEGAEDNPTAAAADLRAIDLTDRDVVVGLAASGRTPYVIGGLDYARSLGADTIAISCNADADISGHAAVAIEADTGPEVLTGSTRMKAGTAQKLICNMLSTVSMVQIGKTYGNLMVDVQPTNAKLVDRARRIVVAATGIGDIEAAQVLATAHGNPKTAIVMQLAGTDATIARATLDAVGGSVRRALSTLTAGA